MTIREYTKLVDDALEFLNNIELQNEYIDDFPQFMSDLARERHAIGEIDEWPNAQG